MASGSFSNVYRSYTLKTNWSSTPNIAGNYSTITCTHYLICATYGALYINSRTNSCNVNGTSVSFTSPAISTTGGVTIHLGTTTHTVNHNSDGKKSVSASTVFNMQATISGVYVSSITASGTMVLDDIPRYFTSTPTISLSSRTETSLTVKWSTSEVCDRVDYNLDGTSQGTIWTGSATSGTFTINNLSANSTHKVYVWCRRKDSQLGTISSTSSFTTYNYPYCTEAPNFTIGSSTTIKVYNPLGRSITLTMVGADGSTRITESFTGTSLGGFSNTNWQNFWYKSIPNSKSGTYKVKVNYGSNVATKTGGTYSIKGTETPTIGTITYADTNTTTTSITGNNQHIVQNKSNLKVTFTSATAKNSATISKHTFELNGVTKTSTSASGTIDFGTINSANNLTLTITVTDSRGLTSKTTKTITMLAHSNPNAIVTLKRLNNYEDESYLTVDGSISSVNGKNTMAIKYRYKVSGGTYGSFTTISDNVKQTLNLDKNNSYIFNIVITDSFGSTYDKEHVLGKGVFPLFIDTVKNSVGINALPRSNNILEVAGRIIESEKEFSIPTNIGSKTGWYLAMSGSFEYVTNKVFLISIQQIYSGGSGLLYLNMRYYDNTLKIERLEWLTQNGISSSNIKVKIEGTSFYVYLKVSANYQQYYLKVIQEKELGGWGFQQYKMYSPTINDTVEEPTGTSPTDFIQTTSSNNGTVIKYPDGTMIINQKYSTTVQSSNWVAWGSLYSAKLSTPPNFPVSFVGNKPTVVQTLETDSANGSLCTQSEGTSISSLTRAGASQVIRPTNPGSTAIFTVHITAIGRWK